MDAFFEDLFRDFQILEKVRFDQSRGQLFPVCSLQDFLLIFLKLTCFERFTARNLVLFKALLSVVNRKLSCDLHRREEIVEGHSAVLLVLGRTESLATLEQLSNDLGFGCGSLELCLLLALSLRSRQFCETLVCFVFLQVEISKCKTKLVDIESKLIFNLV